MNFITWSNQNASKRKRISNLRMFRAQPRFELKIDCHNYASHNRIYSRVPSRTATEMRLSESKRNFNFLLLKKVLLRGNQNVSLNFPLRTEPEERKFIELTIFINIYNFFLSFLDGRNGSSFVLPSFRQMQKALHKSQTFLGISL